MHNTPESPNSAAFFLQAVISFGVSLIAVSIAIIFLPVGGWIRAFLGLGLLFVVTSSFTLAKCIRDQQERSTVLSRVDKARMDKLIADHDPFKVAN